MANEIFISYKREDLEKVKAIKAELDEALRGDHCWIDLEGIKSGHKAYEQEIQNAIQASTVFLFMLSDRSEESINCLKELKWADRTFKIEHVVLVKIDPNFQPKGLFQMEYCEGRDIKDYDNKDQHAKLIRDLREWLNIPEIDPLKEVRERIKKLEGEYKTLSKRWRTIDKQMRVDKKQLGENEFVCPVCGEKNEVEAQYCQRCGYILSFFENASFEEEHLNLLRLNWNAKDDLLKDNERLEKGYTQLSTDIKVLKFQLETSQSELTALKQQYDDCLKYIEEVKKKEEEEATKRLAEEEKRKAFREFTVNGVTFKMIRVEGGTFQMGATNEQGSDADNAEMPVHSVSLSDFMIGETEVTQELWRAVMGSNPSRFKGTKNPVECVSWDDCRDFISKLNTLTDQNFRLPTEAEWEFAARGGKKSGHFKYSGSNEIDKVAWYDGNSDDETHPVGTKEANGLGLYDMSGNVWEWCEDLYGEYDGNPQTNPKGAVKGSIRLYRGGSWNFSARRCRVSSRSYSTPGYRCRNLGLRLAL